MQVSGPRTGAVTLVVPARKLPAAWPRMAVYDPRAGNGGVYVCKSTDRLTCDTVPMATLIRVVGIDPFPGLPESMKREAMTLPPPEDSPYAHAGYGRHRHHEEPSLLEWLLGE